MVRFAFSAESIGIKFGSVAKIYLAFDYGYSQRLYRLLCTSADIGLTNCMTRRPVGIPNEGLPPFMDSSAVRFKLEGGVFGFGLTEVEFKLYKETQSDPVYTFKRRVSISGSCVGGVNVLSSLRLLHQRHEDVNATTKELLHISRSRGGDPTGLTDFLRAVSRATPP
jgi:hypothetical protein